MIFYLKNFFALISLQSKILLEDRANVIGQFILALIEVLTTILFIQILFSYTTNLSGWDKNQMLLLTGVFRIFISLFSTLFLSGVNMIPYYVRTGELDMFLTKPINSQFYTSLRIVTIPTFFKVLSGLFIISIALKDLNPSLLDYLILVSGLVSGLIIFYSIYFFIATLSLWFGRLESLYDVHYIMSEPLSVPTNILGKHAAFVLTYIIPLGFVVTIPASIFLGKSPLYMSLIGMIIAGVFILLSSWFWNFSLKHYTSASS